MEEKVFAVKCGSYSKGEVKDSVIKLFELAGINKTCFGKVLFKPNMLSSRLPEEGVTTHPSVLEEVVSYFDAEEKLIGDSPANSMKPVPVYWERCGFLGAAKASGGKLVKFGSSFPVEVRAAGKTVEVPVTDILKNFPVFNIAKLKTHGLTILTSAMKNLYGLIPGYHKSLLHSKFASPADFSAFLAEYYRAVSGYVPFHMVDAVISMEGKGPSAGTLKKTGYIIGGKNGAAVDKACCRLLGISTKNVPYLDMYEKKYGIPEPDLQGDEIEAVKGFSVPGKHVHRIMSSRAVRPFLQKVANRFSISPEIDMELCRKCFACVQVCPVKAISGELEFDREKCINCMCCFEVCPHKAIKVRKSFIARIFT